MSQAGVLDVENSNPQIPTTFETDSGDAIPLVNILAVVGTNGITTSGLANVLTITGINATAAATVGAAQIGVAAFDSADFTVTNGFVQITGTALGTNILTPEGAPPVEPNGSGTIDFTAGTGIEITGTGPGNTVNFSLTGGSVAIDSIAVQATSGTGTDPVVPVPTTGLITIDGSVVAAQSIPVRSLSASVNQLQIQIQRAADSTGTDTTSQGLSSYDDSQFNVDPNGYVQLIGASPPALSFNIQASTGPGTDPVIADGTGTVFVNGAIVAAQTIPVRSNSLSANTYQIEVQRGAASTGTNTTSQGLVSLDDTQFNVDANGYVTSAGLFALQFDTDGASATPSAGVITIAGGTGITTSGAGSTVTVTLDTPVSVANGGTGATTLTGVLTGNGTSPITANPIAQYAVLVGGASNAVSNVASVGTSGQVLTSNGAGTNPTFQDANSWVDIASGALSNHTGYFATAAATYTLPAGAANGDMVEIVDFIGGGVALTAQNGDIIRVGTSDSSANGTQTSTALGDALRVVFRATGQVWVSAPGAQGNWVDA